MLLNDVKPKRLRKQVRQKQLLDLWIRGFTIDQIAEVLKCTKMTVNRDLKELADKNFDNMVENVDVIKQILNFCTTTNEAVLKEAWANLDKFKSERTKVSTLNLINQTLDQRLGILERLKIIEKVVGTLKHTGGMELRWKNDGDSHPIQA